MYVLLILLYVVILMYGLQVAMGVVEEKSSRVMKLLITAIRPIELMAGQDPRYKGTAGSTQAGLWVASGLVVLLFRNVLGDAVGGIGIDVASVPLPTLLSFLLFILGYVLYAAMYAALGSL